MVISRVFIYHTIEVAYGTTVDNVGLPDEVTVKFVISSAHLSSKSNHG